LGEVEDRSFRAGGDRGRPAASVKSVAVARACARERERERKRETEEEETGVGFKYELVASI
jgi:hypothetical protein